jgi:hypothetical protein
MDEMCARSSGCEIYLASERSINASNSSGTVEIPRATIATLAVKIDPVDR